MFVPKVGGSDNTCSYMLARVSYSTQFLSGPFAQLVKLKCLSRHRSDMHISKLTNDIDWKSFDLINNGLAIIRLLVVLSYGNLTFDYFLLKLQVNETIPSLQPCMACHVFSHHIISFDACDVLTCSPELN